jgi:hypothetical protein
MRRLQVEAELEHPLLRGGGRDQLAIRWVEGVCRS